MWHVVCLVLLYLLLCIFHILSIHLDRSLYFILISFPLRFSVNFGKVIECKESQNKIKCIYMSIVEKQLHNKPKKNKHQQSKRKGSFLTLMSFATRYC